MLCGLLIDSSHVRSHMKTLFMNYWSLVDYLCTAIKLMIEYPKSHVSNTQIVKLRNQKYFIKFIRLFESFSSFLCKYSSSQKFGHTHPLTLMEYPNFWLVLYKGNIPYLNPLVPKWFWLSQNKGNHRQIDHISSLFHQFLNETRLKQQTPGASFYAIEEKLFLCYCH